MEARIMKIWIVVADEREALFYDAAPGGPREPSPLRTPPGAPTDGLAGRSTDSPCKLMLKITNPQGRPDRERETDRPGRAFSSSTGQRHGIDGERSAERRDQEDFARRIADEIERARYAGNFDRLVLAAGPRMLGLIRAALPAPSRAAVAAEVAKDLVRFEGHALIEHLPREALPPRSGPRP
jgi:protein required for attachment to host cells